MPIELERDNRRRSLQHTLIETLSDPNASRLFVPCLDRCSVQAQRNAMLRWLLPDLPVLPWLALPLMPLKLLLLPFFCAYLEWRRRLPQPGWEIDLQNGQLRAVRQRQHAHLQLEPEMGVLAHRQVIQITHPRRGPVLKLFTATCSAATEDKSAQEALAKLFADRLKLPVVGCRVYLG